MFSDEIRTEIIKDVRCCFEGFRNGINDNMLRNMLSINDKAINVDNYACGAYHECACGEMQALFQSIDQAIFHLIGDNEQLKSLFRELHKPR